MPPADAARPAPASAPVNDASPPVPPTQPDRPPALPRREETWPVRALARGLEGLSALTLFALMAVTCVDVFGRYLFNNPLTGSTELTELAVGAVIFSAFPALSWRGEHVVVDILDRFVPPAVARVRGVFFHLCAALGLGFVGARIMTLAERSLSHGEVTEFLAIPTGWMICFLGAMCWLTAGMLFTAGVHATVIAPVPGKQTPAYPE